MKYETRSRTFFIAILFFHFSFFLHAQITDTLTNVQPVDTVAKIIGEISVIGNKITKAKIITRELTFRKGDTIPAAEFDHQKTRSEQNIFNTSLFNSVHITSLTTEAGLT